MVDWNTAINVTFTGIVIVFIMLLLLVLVLMVFGFVASIPAKISAKKSEKLKKAQLAAMKANSEEIVEEAPVASVSTNNELEIVAVISAAIAAMYSGSGKKPVIRSIKKSGSRRSAWASAGIADNTKSF